MYNIHQTFEIVCGDDQNLDIFDDSPKEESKPETASQDPPAPAPEQD